MPWGAVSFGGGARVLRPLHSRVLYTAATREQARPDSAIVDLAAGPLAPSALLLRDYLSGAADGEAFRRRYLWELRATWRTQPEALDDVIALATGGTDCTLVDGWPPVAHAPRHLLAAVLKQVVKAKRRARSRSFRRAAAATLVAGAPLPPPQGRRLSPEGAALPLGK